jgi:YebC/PmpR family DNA-binding regulatory protein
MAGHSKWKNIKYKKAAMDASKAKKFTKLLKEITVAAKTGGGDLATNSHLRLLIEKANQINMPKENYIRAIKRGTGEISGGSYETSFYEGYGPCGISVIIEALSDNKNRAAGEIRRAFTHNGGIFAENGCVSWMFEKRGLITASHETLTEDELLNELLDFPIEDISVDDKAISIICEPSSCGLIRQALINLGCEIEEANIGYNSKEKINIANEEDEEKISNFLQMLESMEDIQNVYVNI